MEGIVEPLGRPLHQVLRRAVLDLVSTEPRRAFPPVVHVGWPGGGQVVFPARPDRVEHATVAEAVVVDHTLRCDLLAAMIRRATRSAPSSGAVPMVWLTRSGDLELRDVDLDWLAAARAASAEAGLGLTMVVVTRGGWLDPRSGVRREWKRLRPAPAPA